LGKEYNLSQNSRQYKTLSKKASDAPPKFLQYSFFFFFNRQFLPSVKSVSKMRAKPGDRWTTQQMLGLFRSQLWKIAVDTNLTHFANSQPSTRNPFYSELIAKPPALPKTRAPDPHFSGIAHWSATFPGGFAITSF